VGSHKISNRGISLVALVAELALAGIVGSILVWIFSASQKAEQRTSGNNELSEITATLRHVFRDYDFCRSSGILDTVVKLNPTELSKIPLSISLPGQKVVVSDHRRSALSARVIDSLRFASLTSLGAVPGGTLYLAKLKLKTSLADPKGNNGITTEQSIYTKLILNSNLKVVDCAAGKAAGVSQLSPGQCSVTGTYLAKINSDGTWDCRPLNTTLYDSGWRPMPVNPDGTVNPITITHNLGHTLYTPFLEYRGPDISPTEAGPISGSFALFSFFPSFATGAHDGHLKTASWSWPSWDAKTKSSLQILVRTDYFKANSFPKPIAKSNLRFVRVRLFPGDLAQ